jgi:hypothetical protein
MVYCVSLQNQGIQRLITSNKQISTITLFDRIRRIVLEEMITIRGFLDKHIGILDWCNAGHAK